MISTTVLVSAAVEAILSVVWVIVIYLLCRQRMGLSWRNIAIGVFVYLLFVLVLGGALNSYVLTRNMLTAGWLSAHELVAVLYGIVAMSVLEELGRFLGMRLLVRPMGDPGTAVAYGIGHGGMESIAWGPGTITMALMLNAGTLGLIFQPDAVDEARAYLEQFSMSDGAIAGMGWLVGLLIQIALSLLVWRAVVAQRWSLLFAAIILHAAADLPGALARAGYLHEDIADGTRGIIGVVLLVAFAAYLPGKAVVRSKISRPIA
jgi:uncharacterized membrane protein YhfC